MNDLERLAALLGAMRIVDLSHVLEEDMPIWVTHSRFYKMVWNSPKSGDEFTSYQMIINDHNGTHVDAPIHYEPDGVSIEKVPLETYFGPCAVIDVSRLGEGGVVAPADISAWERENGPINRGDMVLFNCGWAKHWKKMPDHLPYITGYPGLGGPAAEYLRDRGVKLVGCDPLGVDASVSTDSAAHHTLLRAGIAVAENLTNLDLLPPRCILFCLPLRIRDATASPVRAMALVPPA